MAQLNAESLTQSGDQPAVIIASQRYVPISEWVRTRSRLHSARRTRIGLVLSCTQHVQLAEHVGDLGIGHETLPY